MSLDHNLINLAPLAPDLFDDNEQNNLSLLMLT